MDDISCDLALNTSQTCDILSQTCELLQPQRVITFSLFCPDIFSAWNPFIRSTKQLWPKQFINTLTKMFLLTKQAYIPIEKIIRTSKQSASTSWQCNTTGNRHQPATYGDLCLKRFIKLIFWKIEGKFRRVYIFDDPM